MVAEATRERVSMNGITLKSAAAAALLAAAATGLTACNQPVPSGAVQERTRVTHHRTMEIDGVRVFYREAGPEEGPVVLLLLAFLRLRACFAI
jgi:hypothetical protein